MIMRYDPLREMATLQDRMNRVFDEMLRRPGFEPEAASLEWRPLADVFEEEKEIVISIDLPGVSRDDIQLSVENGVLSIRGERKLPHDDRKQDYHRIEKPVGPFSRSFSLPSAVDPSRIQASFRDGVLEISLVKREESRPRSIQVQVG